MLPAAGAAAALAAAGGLWLGLSPRDAPAATAPIPKVIGPAEIAALQVQATEACKCARAADDRDGEEACWADFERVRAVHGDGNEVSPCGALSPQTACFAGAEECVITQYSNYDGVSFCTPEEVREVTAALGRAYEAGESSELDVLKRFHRAYRAGRKAGPPRSVHGCAG